MFSASGTLLVTLKHLVGLALTAAWLIASGLMLWPYIMPQDSSRVPFKVNTSVLSHISSTCMLHCNGISYPRLNDAAAATASACLWVLLVNTAAASAESRAQLSLVGGKPAHDFW